MPRKRLIPKSLSLTLSAKIKN